jgi:hypothetical protein
MIEVKQGRRGPKFRQLRRETLLGLIIVDTVFQAHDVECVLTEFQRDPREGKPSLHPDGWAFDIRANHMTERQRFDVSDALERAMSDQDGGWDIVLHGKGANIHFHCEYQPKPDELPQPR